MTDDEIISLARRRMDDAASADQSNREEAKDDLRFLIGDQWPADLRQERDLAKKPCLTFNGLSKAYRVCGYRAGWLTITGPKDHAKGFIEGLNKAGIKLNRKSLSEIAIADPAGFTKLVEQAKAAVK